MGIEKSGVWDWDAAGAPDPNMVFCRCGRLARVIPANPVFAGCVFRGLAVELPSGETIPPERCSRCEATSLDSPGSSG